MMSTTGRPDGTDQGIAETDSPIGNDLQTGGDTGAESVIIVTGEMIPMTGLKGAAGILLTRGPAAEATIIVGRVQPEATP